MGERRTDGRTNERHYGKARARPNRAAPTASRLLSMRIERQGRASERAAGQRGRARPLLPRQLDARCSLRIWRRFCPRRDNVPPRESPASDDFIINPFQASTSIEAADRAPCRSALSASPARARVCCLQGSLTPLRRRQRRQRARQQRGCLYRFCCGRSVGVMEAATAAAVVQRYCYSWDSKIAHIGRSVGWSLGLSSPLLKFDMPLLSLSFSLFLCLVASRPLCALLQSFEIWRLFLEELFCKGASKIERSKFHVAGWRTTRTVVWSSFYSRIHYSLSFSLLQVCLVLDSGCRFKFPLSCGMGIRF